MIMKSTVLFAVLLSVTSYSVAGSSCGGLLEGEQGHFSFTNSSNQAPPITSSSSCLWIIQLHYETNIRFTLRALGEGALLNVYPEDELTSCGPSYHTKLTSTQVGSSFEFLGKTLIVILPNSLASLAFSWHFVGNKGKKSSVTIMKNADYIDSPNGLLEWEQLQTVERVTWGINTNANFHIKWDVDVATSCENIDKCACLYFAIFQLTSKGVLSEAVRTCGQSSEGKLERMSGRVVVLMKVNSAIEPNKVAVSWEPVDEVVTQPPVTESPVPAKNGLFAATERGLIALNLQNLEVKYLTSEYAYAVAVNPNLKKVYWSEGRSNSRIMRSDFNGSDIEITVPPTGGLIYALAVHEPSGNVYYSVRDSNEITVCNAIGESCAVVLSNSSLACFPWSIAFDYDKNVMYWSNYEPGRTSLIRANLDGSNVTIISSGFSTSYDVAITLVQPSNDIIYWADYRRNTIGTVNANGSNKETLLELEGNPAPDGIQVDAHKIFFGNWIGKTIQSVDRDSGEELTTIYNSTGGIRHLALFSTPASELWPLY